MKINYIQRGITMLLIGLYFGAGSLSAQNFPALYQQLKKRVQEEPLKISGGLAANFDFLTSTDTLRNQTPLNYRLSANLNIDLLGIRIPLSANFSNAKLVYNYQLPAYSFVGLSPTYKWATLHLGDRSMNFSPYTLSGQSFYGIGTELQPGKFRFSALYGRLQKPIQEIVQSNGSKGPEPAFQRMAWGLKTGYENSGNAYNIIIFHAADDPYSLDSLVEHPQLKPAANLAIGLTAQQQLNQRLFVAVEYALSAITADLEEASSTENVQSGFSFGNLLQTNLSTQYFNAFKSSLGMKLSKTATVQINYERVDPGYRTFGTLFFNDNMENYTASSTTSLWDRKLNLSANAGVQRNNLNGQQSNSALRFVGSLNASIRASERINLSTTYSNFRNTNIREVTIESLQNNSTSLSNVQLTSFITQVSQNANVSLTYALGKEKKANLAALFSYQQASNIENQEVLIDQQSTFYVGSLSHSYAHTASKLSFSTSMMFNYGEIPQSDIWSLAPTLAISRPFMENTLQVSTIFSLANSYANNILSNQIFTSQLSIRLSKFKKHPLNFNVRYIQRANTSISTNDQSLQEFSGTLSYNYRFAPNLKRKKN